MTQDYKNTLKTSSKTTVLVWLNFIFLYKIFVKGIYVDKQ